ncbi:hypothetical protein H9Y04_37485 [Streptomyces sp. TRM66268-LWL]|uniref:Uncharacterized protein n=1 Tax=Streptomyces polyasparticus TaxID=2767826 RepID=A0ABR7SS66_9ACTN|nr:hypothetical protein [Streptomyces polyasparticus]MBC9718233.1 hypothetical protein [Streptomyces polyasparticus]
MIPEAHLYVHHQRTTELPHAPGELNSAEEPSGMRVRLGWTLVHVGLRLATPGRPAPAFSS